LKPSLHNIDTAPLWFDFENINVATIRDGYKGRYFLTLNISENIPDKFRGKLHHIKVKLNKEYFDKLPNYNDPAPAAYVKRYHDYDLTIPDIVFGVPYKDDHPLGSTVYWTSGHAYDISLTHNINIEHTPTEACIVSQETVDELSKVTGNLTDLIVAMQDFWTGVHSSCIKLPFSIVSSDGKFNTIKFDFSKFGGSFPFPNYNDSNLPEIASIIIMVNTFAPQVECGRKTVSSVTSVKYMDDKPKEKSDSMTSSLQVNFVGPYLTLYIDSVVYNSDMIPKTQSQPLTNDESGFVKMMISAINTGNTVAFNTKLTFNVPKQLKVEKIEGFNYTINPVDDSVYSITINTGMNLSPGTLITVSALFVFGPITKNEVYNSARLFLKSSSGTFELTDVEGSYSVTQNLQSKVLWPLEGSEDYSTGAWFRMIGLPIILAIALIGALIAFAAIKHHKDQADVEMFNNSVNNPSSSYAKTSGAGVGGASGSPSGANKPNNANEAGPVRHKIANTNYLMTGGVGRVVKDGNPTALDDGEEDDDVKRTRNELPESQPQPKPQSQPKKSDDGSFFDKLKDLFTFKSCRS